MHKYSQKTMFVSSIDVSARMYLQFLSAKVLLIVTLRLGLNRTIVMKQECSVIVR